MYPQLHKRRKIKKALREAGNEYEYLWMKYPMPYGEILYHESAKSKKKVMVQVVGDPFDAVKNTDKYKGIMKLAALIYAEYKERQMLRICKSAMVFTNGSKLHEKFSSYGKRSNVTNITSSVLIESDYYERADVCEGDRIKMLYVGFLQKRKGLEYLLSAFKEIIKLHPTAELTIVGDGEDKERIEGMIEEYALADKVQMSGFIPIGRKLNSLHIDSDIFVYPTIAGEGTPRAIIHAMAHSMAVVATDVSGIPDVVKHETNGLLVPPKSPDAIISAIDTLVTENKLRRKLIKNAYYTARRHKMSSFLDRMFDALFSLERQLESTSVM